MSKTKANTTETAIFANGCFWCTEAVFQRLKGVEQVTSGYIGGETPNPTYEQVSSGNSGHAEALQIIFNPEEISYTDLLNVFWNTHNPTQLNQQGNDIGTQYRSAIFYLNSQQKVQAEISKDQFAETGEYSEPIVTEITKASEFYPAENYHQDYYNQNQSAPYCQFVISPKLQKLQEKFTDKVVLSSVVTT